MSSHVIVAPSIETFFGRTPGADRTLIDWPEMLAWFEEIERASPRLRMESIGQATDGGEMVLLTIADPATIGALDSVRDRRRALADEALLRDPANENGRLAGDKTVVLLTAGIHATEVGGVQLMPELVADLALSDDEAVARMLEHVILLIVPTLNPDGMDLVHRWYRDTLGTPAEGSAPPALYHRYAGHDNNRDWYTHALVETRNTVEHAHNPWRPHIVLDLHQMQEHAPRYVVPPYIDPVEPHVHPLINALSTEVGAFVASRLVQAERPGACSGVMFDCYSPTRAYQHYHGGVRILAEAASAKLATPVAMDAGEIKPQRGFDANIPSVHNPVPWPGGTWRLRDIMDYHLTTIHAVLEHAALHRDAWLRNQWKMLADQVHEDPPLTFAIAPLRHQIDPPATRDLIAILTGGDVTVDYVTQSNPSVPAGSFLVRADQPFGSYARALLELTPYPVPARAAGTPSAIPYDVTSHCLPVHMGVDVRRIDGEATVESRPLAPGDLTPFTPLVASDVTRDRWLAIDARSHVAVSIAARAIANGADVRRLVRPHFDGGRVLPIGTWLVTDDNAFAAMADANRHALRTWLVRPVATGTIRQRMPRIGLHLSWRPNASDGGWMQLVLERLGIPFDVLRDADFSCGAIGDYDVIVVPHVPGQELLDGNSEKVYPPAYANGLGTAGIAGLLGFLKHGGYLVAIDGSARALIEAMRLPVDLPTVGLKPAQFSCPGSMLRVVADPTHPLTLGMDESITAFMNQ
ncbi:MAG TPA: M14 family zinc carboxypeptidase, partial [Thermomicrobiales bacterium]|nr:M14 family zinc carboxypeptidase [Thermomicrobiales bacterium]